MKTYTGLPLSLKTEISKLAKENCQISKNSNRIYQKKQKIAKLLFSFIYSYYVVYVVFILCVIVYVGQKKKLLLHDVQYN